jgi:hypothetical protein
MTALLPPNTDKEYRKAKADFQEKVRRRAQSDTNTVSGSKDTFGDAKGKSAEKVKISMILDRSNEIQRITNLLSTIEGYELWLSGGDSPRVL